MSFSRAVTFALFVSLSLSALSPEMSFAKGGRSRGRGGVHPVAKFTAMLAVAGTIWTAADPTIKFGKQGMVTELKVGPFVIDSPKGIKDWTGKQVARKWRETQRLFGKDVPEPKKDDSDAAPAAPKTAVEDAVDSLISNADYAARVAPTEGRDIGEGLTQADASVALKYRGTLNFLIELLSNGERIEMDDQQLEKLNGAINPYDCVATRYNGALVINDYSNAKPKAESDSDSE